MIARLSFTNCLLVRIRLSWQGERSSWPGERPSSTRLFATTMSSVSRDSTLKVTSSQARFSTVRRNTRWLAEFWMLQLDNTMQLSNCSPVKIKCCKRSILYNDLEETKLGTLGSPFLALTLHHDVVDGIDLHLQVGVES